MAVVYFGSLTHVAFVWIVSVCFISIKTRTTISSHWPHFLPKPLPSIACPTPYRPPHTPTVHPTPLPSTPHPTVHPSPLPSTPHPTVHPIPYSPPHTLPSTPHPTVHAQHHPPSPPPILIPLHPYPPLHRPINEFCGEVRYSARDSNLKHLSNLRPPIEALLNAMWRN